MRVVRLTLDEKTIRLLDRLALRRGITRGSVACEAVRRMAEQERFEEYLDRLEVQPAIRRSMERALADLREGRTVSHEQALRVIGKARKR